MPFNPAIYNGYWLFTRTARWNFAKDVNSQFLNEYIEIPSGTIIKVEYVTTVDTIHRFKMSFLNNEVYGAFTQLTLETPTDIYMRL